MNDKVHQLTNQQEMDKSESGSTSLSKQVDLGIPQGEY